MSHRYILNRYIDTVTYVSLINEEHMNHVTNAPFLFKFLPYKWRYIMVISMNLFRNLNTIEEIEQAGKKFYEMDADQMITVSEWAKFGKQLRILGKKKTGRHAHQKLIDNPKIGKGY